MDHPRSERIRLNAIALAHALIYATLVAAVSTVAAVLVGVGSGGGVVRAKILLFLIGWGLMAYAVIKLWPSDASEYRTQNPEEIRKEKTSAGSNSITPDSIPAEQTQSRLQTIAREIPPARWLPQPTPSHRFTLEAKLFLSSVFVLLTSFLMETVLGVGAA